ncbi:MAG: J domain-containing protein [Spirochaetes bacterium]|nr:J domain-containing protein [Spirochaetota bacterium]
MNELREKLVEAYKTLGISADSSLDEITKKYRKLAKKYHPDSNPKNPAGTHDMIVKINDAYNVIKESYAKGYSAPEILKEDSTYHEFSRTLRMWQDRYDRIKKREEELLRRKLEKERRERDAFKEYFVKAVEERKMEIADRKSHEIIVRYTRELIALFFTKNFHNTILRERPFMKKEFEEYMSTYTVRLKEIFRLRQLIGSERYKKNSFYIYEFLQAFIEDIVKTYSAGLDRRASALQSFRTAAGNSEKFVEYYFSSLHLDDMKVSRQFKNTLNSFKYFLQSFPESPLTPFAESKIEVLDKLYRAFLKRV